MIREECEVLTLCDRCQELIAAERAFNALVAADDTVEIIALRLEVDRLRTENEWLRAENERLRAKIEKPGLQPRPPAERPTG